MIFHKNQHDYLHRVVNSCSKPKYVHRIYSIRPRKCGPYTYYYPDFKHKEFKHKYPFLIVMRAPYS